tara:strand:- start:19 stop:1008 length:990 start_codon:yes stop_codon:yes gene_type:complete
MKRKKVLTKNDYSNFVNSHNNRTNVYTTVYDFEEFSETTAIDASVVLNRIFLDFDAHEQKLEEAYRDVEIIMGMVKDEDLMHTLFFSGRGFHLFIEGERTNDIRNIQAYFKVVKEFLRNGGGGSSLDDRVGQATRLRRVPNTVNMASDDGQGNPLYCIPLFYEDVISMTLSEVIEMARSPRLIPFRKSGSKRVVFPEQPPIEMVEGEVSVPQHDGNLPILPCLYHATMVENPGHFARVYLVQWWRDILTNCTGVQLRGEQAKPIINKIMDEIHEVYGKSEDVWLDWNERESRKHVSYTVRNNRFSPSCKTLISNGYCVGKCWRFPNGKK